MPEFDQQSLPDSPAQITPVFLTNILRSTGSIQQVAVTAVDCQTLVGQVSFNAQLARLHLTYDRFEAGAPRSLIAKLPTVDTELHENAVVFRPRQRECWFYRQGAARTPLKVPVCFYNAVDAATGESFLLLEDLAPARTGSRIHGVSLQEAQLALRSIAGLHAAWWGVDPSLEPELAQMQDNAQAAQDLVEKLYAAAWPKFLLGAASEIPDDVRQFGEGLVGRVAAAEALLDASPRTLMHGDFRLENMLFGLQDGRQTCWVIDWEDIFIWNGMFDVAWFLGSSLPVELCDQEEALVRGYHQALTRAGVTGYPWSQCYNDYRCAMLSSFVQGILTVAGLEAADDYSRSLARVLTQRFVSACRRLHLDELLPE